MIANYHTHTRWCRHADGEIEDYIQEALRRGLKALAITDHGVMYGVVDFYKEQIEKRLQKKIETMNADDFVEFIGIYNAIKQGESKIADWFEAVKAAEDLTQELLGEEPLA